MATVKIAFQPLTQWPAGRQRTPAHEVRKAQFKSPGRVENAGTEQRRYVGPTPIAVERTYDDLDRELSQIGASDVVVQTNKRGDPAVVLTFKRKGVSHTFACDAFDRWQDNLRGITLGLEGLRRLERYGIVQSGEQYRGWQALPSSTTPALSTEAAADVIAKRAGWRSDVVLRDREHAKNAVRAARAKTHPDAGGATADFTLVQEAARVLGLHHGVTL